LIQIGVRQSDKEENQIAIENGVVTFDAWSVRRDMEKLLDYIKANTANRKIYISFDIDVYDLPYVPCTGTPEPFGLDPFDVQKIINAIYPSAELLGLDMVEVSLRNNDYREGTLATQTLYRVLSAPFI
jgi:arginase family enzyme